MKFRYQLSNYAAQLWNHEAEIQRAVCAASFVETGFGRQLECWQFNSPEVIFAIGLERKKRRTNVLLWAVSVWQ
jgi:hypothetical protein